MFSTSNTYHGSWLIHSFLGGYFLSLSVMIMNLFYATEDEEDSEKIEAKIDKNLVGCKIFNP
jgi:hypothetical protein